MARLNRETMCLERYNQDTQQWNNFFLCFDQQLHIGNFYIPSHLRGKPFTIRIEEVQHNEKEE
jgi:hypothetical protein